MANKKLIDTYTLLTAENIMQQLDMPLSDKQLLSILKKDATFYKKLLHPVCEYILTQQLDAYCESLGDYERGQIENLNIAYQTQLNKNQAEPATVKPMLDQLDHLNDQINSLNLHRNKLAASRKELFDKIKEILQQHIKQWLTMQAENANQLTQALIDDGFTLPVNFRQKLTENLQYQAFDLKKIPGDALITLKIKNRQPTFIEEAIIHALYEV